MPPFNFGPIARTSAGDTNDTINLASFPLHVMLNALVGSTSVEEFIAWLWHDLYKPAFYWDQSEKGPRWNHIPGIGVFKQAERVFADRTGIREGLVSTHHFGVKDASGDWLPRLQILEPNFISDQGDQINLGATVNYIQLSLAAEPALPTLLTRSVIADAFIEVVTNDVAKALKKAFIDAGRTPIEQVRFEFETVSNLTCSSPPTDIWDTVGKHFDICMDGNTFIMRHLTPVADPKHESFETVFTADLTGNPLFPDEMLKNTFSLAELLVLYQDSRTVIIAVPQDALYSEDRDLSRKILEIKNETLNTSRRRLEKDFNVLTKKDKVDYLSTAFDSQIEISEVPKRLRKRPKRQKGVPDNFRPLNDAVQRPTEMLTEARNSSNGRLCCVTGTWFKANLSASFLDSKNLFNPNFVDTEFVSLVEDSNQERYLSPLAYLYVINSSGAGKGEETRKAFRGSFAYLAPASHFAIDEHGTKAIERPPLDKGGRFASQLNRVTVTTQEFTLFQQMSRRIIAQLWQNIGENERLPLPYLGSIVLTQEPEQRPRINQLLPQLDLLFSEVSLEAYPFKLYDVKLAIEIALEISVHDKERHHTKHTLLKTTPQVITVDPRSSVPILIDDNVRVDLSEEFFTRVNLLTDIIEDLTRRKKKVNQRDLWLKLVLTNNDPVTAVFESAVATLNTKHLPKTWSLEDTAFKEAENFWDGHIDKGDFAQSWKQYETLNQKSTSILEEFPALLLLLQTLQKKDEN